MPGLYLGPYGAAKDLPTLQAHRVTHILVIGPFRPFRPIVVQCMLIIVLPFRMGYLNVSSSRTCSQLVCLAPDGLGVAISTELPRDVECGIVILTATLVLQIVRLERNEKLVMPKHPQLFQYHVCIECAHIGITRFSCACSSSPSVGRPLGR